MWRVVTDDNLDIIKYMAYYQLKSVITFGDVVLQVKARDRYTTGTPG